MYVTCTHSTQIECTKHLLAKTTPATDEKGLQSHHQYLLVYHRNAVVIHHDTSMCIRKECITFGFLSLSLFSLYLLVLDFCDVCNFAESCGYIYPDLSPAHLLNTAVEGLDFEVLNLGSFSWSGWAILERQHLTDLASNPKVKLSQNILTPKLRGRSA